MDSRVFTAHVDDEEQIRDARHVADTTQKHIQALDFSFQTQGFSLGHFGEITAVPHPLQAFQFIDPLADGDPVGQGSAQPASRNPGHTTAGRLHLNGLLSLTLGAHKKDCAALGDGIPHQGVSIFQSFNSLLQVDDVNVVPLSEDKRLHSRVPLMGAMSKMDAAF